MIYKYILLLTDGGDKDIANCKSLQFIYSPASSAAAAVPTLARCSGFLPSPPPQSRQSAMLTAPLLRLVCLVLPATIKTETTMVGVGMVRTYASGEEKKLLGEADQVKVGTI